MDVSATALETTIESAVAFTFGQQQQSGEFPSVAAFLDAEQPEWADDTLVFITSLVLLALDRVDPKKLPKEQQGRAVAFLDAQREPGALWRYWDRDHERHGFTPPDADDTACASMALNLHGIETPANVRTLLANRDASGKFYTWLVPHRPRLDGLLGWWDLRTERFARRRRHELWTDMEAEHDDVDAVVNANIIRYLADRSPQSATEWIAKLIEDDQEAGADSWYHSRHSLYASVADAQRRGIARFRSLGDAIDTKIGACVRSDGGVGTPLETALALGALVDYGRMTSAVPLAKNLLATQQEDGSWPRCVCYHGGPSESFGWASDALTAATAAGALSGLKSP